jgi:hypothetical protein
MIELGIVIAVVVGVPLVLAVITGSISIPHNDAWSYSRIAQVFATTGKIRLLGWNRGALIGQFIMLGPLARWILAQQLAVAVLAVLSLCLTYKILAKRLTPRRAVLGTALVGVFPGFGLLATSFMEDIPAFTAAIGCLAIADVALEKRSRLLLVIALALGFFGATIREQVLAAPVAALLAAYFAGSRRERRTICVMAAIFCILFGLFEFWRQSLQYANSPSLHLQVHTAVVATIQAYFTLSLILSPVILISGKPQRHRIVGYGLGIFVGGIGIAETIHLHGSIFIGNYLSATGAYTAADIGSHTIFAAWVMDLLISLALVAGILLPPIVVSNWADLDPLLLGFTVLTILGTIGEVVVGQGIFDRYLLVLLLPGAVICLRSTRSQFQAVPAVMALASLAAISLLISANGLSLDAAQWHEAENLVSDGIPATSVDAGFDWVGFHSPLPAQESSVGGVTKIAVWTALFPRSHACLLVAAGPIYGQKSIDHFYYRTYAVFGTSWLDIYRMGLCPKGG